MAWRVNRGDLLSYRKNASVKANNKLVASKKNAALTMFLLSFNLISVACELAEHCKHGVRTLSEAHCWDLWGPNCLKNCSSTHSWIWVEP